MRSSVAKRIVLAGPTVCRPRNRRPLACSHGRREKAHPFHRSDATPSWPTEARLARHPVSPLLRPIGGIVFKPGCR